MPILRIKMETNAKVLSRDMLLPEGVDAKGLEILQGYIQGRLKLPDSEDAEKVFDDVLGEIRDLVS